MEKFNNTLLEEWVNNNPELLTLLKEIDLQADTEIERAEIAFQKLAQYFNLTKHPEDALEIDENSVDDNYQEPLSIYEVLGKVKFANPDPLLLKSNVLLSAYLIVHDYDPLIDEELEQYLKGEELAGLGFKGEGICVEMIPIKKGESWFDKGCTLFIRKT